jgi:transcriptional regulator with XRE-family HTH domain
MRKNRVEAQPYAVERALKTVGRNLRTARVRRGLTRAEAAEGIGTGVRAVMDAENGNAFTGMAVYTALLWLYDLLPPLEELASPLKDSYGLALAGRRERVRAQEREGRQRLLG